MPQTVGLTSASAQCFSRVDIYTSAGYPAKDFDIIGFAADVQKWVLLATVTGNTATSMMLPLTQQFCTNQLAVNVKRGPDVQPAWARINEIEVY